ncbi:hypothetical protein [Acidisoma sp. 7E03]
MKGRTREADLYRATVRALTAHLGDEPPPVQALLIGQLAWLQVHISKLNEAALDGVGLSEPRLNQLLELHRLYARGLRDIGLKQPDTDPQPPSWNAFLGSLSTPDEGVDA